MLLHNNLTYCFTMLGMRGPELPAQSEQLMPRRSWLRRLGQFLVGRTRGNTMPAPAHYSHSPLPDTAYSDKTVYFSFDADDPLAPGRTVTWHQNAKGAIVAFSDPPSADVATTWSDPQTTIDDTAPPPESAAPPCSEPYTSPPPE